MCLVYIVQTNKRTPHIAPRIVRQREKREGDVCKDNLGWWVKYNEKLMTTTRKRKIAIRNRPMSHVSGTKLYFYTPWSTYHVVLIFRVTKIEPHLLANGFGDFDLKFCVCMYVFYGILKTCTEEG